MKKSLIFCLLLFTCNALAGELQIENGSVSNITRTSADIYGEIISTNATNAAITLFYGTSDGSTNSTNWAYSNYYGTAGTGIISTNVTGLAPSQLYYYRWYAFDSVSNVHDWADYSSNFWTKAGAPTSTPAIKSHAVMVDTNGNLVSPTNFFDRNNVAKRDFLFSGENSTGSVSSAAGDAGKYLKADGSWDIPSGGTATNLFNGAGSTGMVTSASSDTNKYLKGDGSWGSPSGSGDMQASTYDTNNIAKDIFTYVDERTANTQNWDEAYSWGDHSSQGYLTSESDPDFSSSVAADITSTHTQNWDEAYSWGDHSAQGYITDYTNLFSGAGTTGSVSSTAGDIDKYLKGDGTWGSPGGSGDMQKSVYDTNNIAKDIFTYADERTANTQNWDEAYSWGDHSLQGYLTSESDPDFSSSVAADITSTHTQNWDEAYSWGDHSAQGYITDYTNLFSGAGTTGTVSSTAGDAGKYLKADGSWDIPSGGGGDYTNLFQGAGTTGSVTSTSSDLGKYLRGDGTWATPDGTGGGSSTSICFSVYSSTNWSMPGLATVKMPVDTEMLDKGNVYDLAGDNRCEIPEDGEYVFVASQLSENPYHNWHLYRNGTNFFTGPTVISSGDDSTFFNSGPVSCTAGEYFEMYCENKGGTTRTMYGGAGTNWFAGWKIGGPKGDKGDSGTGVGTNMAFRVYCSTNFTLGSFLTTKVPFDTEVHDNGSDYDLPGNNRYNVPEDGFYTFSANWTVLAVAYVNCHIYTNGVSAFQASTYNNAYEHSGSLNTGPMYLTNGAYVEVYVQEVEGNTETVIGGSTKLTFSGYKIDGIKGDPGTGGIGTNITFLVNLSSNVSLTAATWTKISFDTERSDDDGIYDHTNDYRCEIKEDGYYVFDSKLGWYQDALQVVALYTNGAWHAENAAYRASPNNQNWGFGGTFGPVFLSSNDYVEIYAYGGELNTIYSDKSYFGGWKVDGIKGDAGTGDGGSSTSVCFRVYVSTNITISGSTELKIPFDTEEFDHSSDYNLTSNKFVTPNTGMYYFDAQGIYAAAGQMQMYLYKNGSRWLRGGGYVGSSGGSRISTGPVSLAANDEIEFYIHNSGGDPMTLYGSSTNNWFTGYQLK